MLVSREVLLSVFGELCTATVIHGAYNSGYKKRHYKSLEITKLCISLHLQRPLPGFKFILTCKSFRKENWILVFQDKDRRFVHFRFICFLFSFGLEYKAQEIAENVYIKPHEDSCALCFLPCHLFLCQLRRLPPHRLYPEKGNSQEASPKRQNTT